MNLATMDDSPNKRLPGPGLNLSIHQKSKLFVDDSKPEADPFLIELDR